ncbi:unnamed protein product [Trichobilharzia regenti]|nr:unnamed protein product [Trichobilharzia regenti]
MLKTIEDAILIALIVESRLKERLQLVDGGYQWNPGYAFRPFWDSSSGCACISQTTWATRATSCATGHINHKRSNENSQKVYSQVFAVKEIPLNADLTTSSSVRPIKHQTMNSDDIRTCLTGLSESIDWFIHESYLVPINVVECIESGTTVDYYMDHRFWCILSRSSSPVDNDGSNENIIEVNANFVQIKLRELDNIESKSLEWKNCMNVFCDKAKSLLKTGYDSSSSSSSNTRAELLLNQSVDLNRLEDTCSKAENVLSLAFMSLRRYREILHTFKTNLAKFEGCLRQIELIKNSVDDPDQTVQDLSVGEWLKSLCQQTIPHKSKRDGLATVSIYVIFVSKDFKHFVF